MNQILRIRLYEDAPCGRQYDLSVAFSTLASKHDIACAIIKAVEKIDRAASIKRREHQ